jgi:two-component system sensor histidine kinase VanS
VTRPAGTSVRVRLTLSYAAVVVVTGVVLLGVVWLFLLRYVPAEQISLQSGSVPNRTDLVRAFVPRAVTALVVLLVAGLLGGWLLAGRVLAPLTRLRTAARLVGTGSLAHRVRLPGRDDERTPLAITRTVLEVARDDPDHDHAALIGRLLSVNTRAVDLTEALLLLGRAGRRPSARESVDLSLAAEESTEALLPLAEARGIVLEVTGTTAHALGVPALLLQLVTNLVHNAIVHNAESTAAGGTRLVRVTTATEVLDDEPVATLVVENTGPLLSPAIVATLTEPFQRGTARVHQDQAGSGLGLAIVDAVVRAHEGTLRLDPRGGGGLVVTVRLPGADTSPSR